MKVKASVELGVTLVPSGIQVGETLITWGYLMERPEVRATMRLQLDAIDKAMANPSFSSLDVWDAATKPGFRVGAFPLSGGVAELSEAIRPGD